MAIFNIHEAKTHLSRLLERVAAGETISIARAGQPVALLTPYVAPDVARRPGAMRGRIVMDDDFDIVDERIADACEGVSESE